MANRVMIQLLGHVILSDCEWSYVMKIVRDALEELDKKAKFLLTCKGEQS